MADRKLGPSSGKCSKCGGYKSINPPRPCMRCAGERRAVPMAKKERTFTESEVRAFVAALKDETLSKLVDHRIDHVARKVLFLDPA